MSRSDLDLCLDVIIDATLTRASELGFHRSRLVLKTYRHGNAGLIEFQKSRKSSSEEIIFTINLAVVCGALLESHQPPVEKTKVIDAHLRQRIGMFLPGRPDKWWNLGEDSNVYKLASEISEIVRWEGAPFVLRYLDSKDLVALWESGESPGLTQLQRIRYLNSLKSMISG